MFFANDDGSALQLFMIAIAVFAVLAAISLSNTREISTYDQQTIVLTKRPGAKATVGGAAPGAGPVVMRVAQTAQSYRRITLVSDGIDTNETAFLQHLARMFPLQMAPRGADFTSAAAPHGLLALISSANAVPRESRQKWRFVCRAGTSVCTLLLPATSRLAIRELDSRDKFIARAEFQALHTPERWQGTRIAVHRTSEWIFRTLNRVLELGAEVRVLRDATDDSWLRDSDGLFMATSHPNSDIVALTRNARVQFYDFDTLFKQSPRLRTLLQFHFPEARPTAISLDPYRVFNLGSVAQSTGFPLFFACTEDCDPDTIFHFARTIYKHLEPLSARHPVLRQHSSFSRSLLGTAPADMEYHPGSLLFFQEQGNVSLVNGDECALVDGPCTSATIQTVRALRSRGLLPY